MDRTIRQNVSDREHPDHELQQQILYIQQQLLGLGDLPGRFFPAVQHLRQSQLPVQDQASNQARSLLSDPLDATRLKVRPSQHIKKPRSPFVRVEDVQEVQQTIVNSATLSTSGSARRPNRLLLESCRNGAAPKGEEKGHNYGVPSNTPIRDAILKKLVRIDEIREVGIGRSADQNLSAFCGTRNIEMQFRLCCYWSLRGQPRLSLRQGRGLCKREKCGPKPVRFLGRSVDLS